jgi:hypothetical protein
MDKNKVRQRFIFYRQAIALLENQIANLEESANQQEYYANEAIGRAEATARRARDEAQYSEEEARSARYRRESDIRDATRELEFSRDCRDSYGVERAIERLKRL